MSMCKFSALRHAHDRADWGSLCQLQEQFGVIFSEGPRLGNDVVSAMLRPTVPLYLLLP